MPRPQDCPRSQECQAFVDIREVGKALDRLMERPTRVWADSDCVRTWLACMERAGDVQERVHEGLLAKYAPESVQ